MATVCLKRCTVTRFCFNDAHALEAVRRCLFSRYCTLDRGCVKGFAVRAHNREFEGTGTGTALYHRIFSLCAGA